MGLIIQYAFLHPVIEWIRCLIRNMIVSGSNPTVLEIIL